MRKRVRWGRKHHIDENYSDDGKERVAYCHNPRAKAWIDEVPDDVIEEKYNELICLRCHDVYREVLHSRETY